MKINSVLVSSLAVCQAAFVNRPTSQNHKSKGGFDCLRGLSRCAIAKINPLFDQKPREDNFDQSLKLGGYTFGYVKSGQANLTQTMFLKTPVERFPLPANFHSAVLKVFDAFSNEESMSFWLKETKNDESTIYVTVKHDSVHFNWEKSESQMAIVEEVSREIVGMPESDRGATLNDAYGMNEVELTKDSFLKLYLFYKFMRS